MLLEDVLNMTLAGLRNPLSALHCPSKTRTADEVLVGVMHAHAAEEILARSWLGLLRLLAGRLLFRLLIVNLDDPVPADFVEYFGTIADAATPSAQRPVAIHILTFNLPGMSVDISAFGRLAWLLRYLAAADARLATQYVTTIFQIPLLEANGVAVLTGPSLPGRGRIRSSGKQRCPADQQLRAPAGDGGVTDTCSAFTASLDTPRRYVEEHEA